MVLDLVHKIITVILIPAPLLALSQVMCLAPAICPCSGLGGWEEQAEGLCGNAGGVLSFFQL